MRMSTTPNVWPRSGDARRRRTSGLDRPPPRPARWAASRPGADQQGRTSRPWPICPGHGSTGCMRAGRRRDRARHGQQRQRDPRRAGRHGLQRPFRLHLLSSAVLFNQFGDLERCALRPGNVHSADDWREVLEPVVARYRDRMKRRFFRGDAAFAKPGLYEFLEAEGYKYTIRLPANAVLQEKSATAEAPGRPSAERGPALLRQLQLPGRIMEPGPARGGQGRVASGRTVSPRRVHRDQPDPAGRAGGDVLQPARHGGAVDQGGQECGELDAAVLPRLRRNAVRLQLHALAYNLANFLRTLALPDEWSSTGR